MPLTRRCARGGRAWSLLVGCLPLALLLLGGAAAAQVPATTGGGEVRITDEQTTSPLHTYGDARSFRARVRGDRIECWLEMSKPLVESMFTCVELSIDCDDKPATGLGGRELRIRAAVGSRFQPSDAAPLTGTRKPIEHLRISGTDLQPDGHGGLRWIHRHVEAEAPVVHGNELQFWFPRQLLRERGDRYHGRVAMRIEVETSCSDQPIERLHVCNDDGLPIELDGRDADWSAPVVVDAANELHHAARCVDLTGLRVDHGADCLFACVSLAGPGFATWTADDDVAGHPSLTMLVEPMFPSYQDPYEVPLYGVAMRQQGEVPAGSWSSCAGDRLVEVRLPRRRGQNRLRVLVLSDLILRDSFERELRLDTEAR